MRMFDNERQHNRWLEDMAKAGNYVLGDAPARFPCFIYFDRDGEPQYLYASDIVDMATSIGIDVYGRS